MVDGTRTTLASLGARCVMPRQPERAVATAMQLVGGRGRRLGSCPRWADGDEEEDDEEDTRGWMSRRYGSMIPQPAFHGLTHLRTSFSLTLLFSFVLSPFQNCGLHLCATSSCHYPLYAARDEHPSRRACLSASSSDVNGHGRRPACTSCHHWEEEAAKTCSFYDC